MFEKIDKLVMEKFPHIILGLCVFWLGIVVIGLILS